MNIDCHSFNTELSQRLLRPAKRSTEPRSASLVEISACDVWRAFRLMSGTLGRRTPRRSATRWTERRASCTSLSVKNGSFFTSERGENNSMPATQCAKIMPKSCRNHVLSCASSLSKRTFKCTVQVLEISRNQGLSVRHSSGPHPAV